MGVNGVARRVPWSIVGVVLTAAVFRISLLATVFEWPLVSRPSLDGAEYLRIAANWSDGYIAAAVQSGRPLGYPLIVAAVLKVLHGSVFGLLALQCLAGAVTSGLIAGLANRQLGGRFGWAAGLLYALYGPAAALDVQVLGESWLILCVVLSVWLMLVPEQPKSTLAGAVLGVATVLRPTATAAALALWMRYAWLPGPRRAVAATLAWSWLTIVGPTLMVTYAYTGAVQLQAHGGLNLYIGNSPHGSGTATYRLGGDYEELQALAPSSGARTFRASDSYYARVLLQEIVHQPTAWLTLLARKMCLFVSGAEARDTYSYAWFREVAPQLSAAITFWMVFPFAAIGAVAAQTRGRIDPAVAGVTLAMSLTVVLLVVGWRYRAPVVPFMCLYAAAGLASIATACRSLSVAGGLRIGLLVAAAASSYVGPARSEPGTAEEWAWVGFALMQEGQTVEAQAYLDRAILGQPESGLAWAALAELWFRRQDDVKALAAAQRGLSRNAENPRALRVLGALALARKDVYSAAGHLARAARTRPAYAKAGVEEGLARLTDQEAARVSSELAVAAGQIQEGGPTLRRIAEGLSVQYAALPLDGHP